MTLLALALLVFGVVHAVPAIPAAKAWAMQRLGSAFGAVYGITSLVLLVLAVAAFRNAEPELVYAPPSWGNFANYGLSFLAFLCFSIFLFRGSFRNTLKFPVAIGIAFWAVGHLLANGDTRSVLFFGGLFVIAVIQVLLYRSWTVWEPSEVRKGHDFLAIIFGVAFYGVVVQLHGLIAGVPVFSIEGFRP